MSSLLAPVAAPPVEGQALPLDEYLAFELECPEFVEYYSGRIHFCPAPGSVHQFSSSYVHCELVLKARIQGGQAVSSPFLVALPTGDRFHPDLVYLAPGQLDGVKEDGFHGAPALVMEILSKSTEKYDQTIKYQAYEKSGVEEYWVLDPVNETIRLYRLIEAKFRQIPPGPQGFASQALPGFCLAEAQVFG